MQNKSTKQITKLFEIHEDTHQIDDNIENQKLKLQLTEWTDKTDTYTQEINKKDDLIQSLQIEVQTLSNMTKSMSMSHAPLPPAVDVSPTSAGSGGGDAQSLLKQQKQQHEEVIRKLEEVSATNSNIHTCVHTMHLCRNLVVYFCMYNVCISLFC